MQNSTDWHSINLEILESVLYNAENAIPKMKIQLEFEDEEKFKKFMNRYRPDHNEDEDVIESDSDAEAEQQIIPEPNDEQATVDLEEISHTEVLSKLQESILLKQFYHKEIEAIGRKMHVRILVIPKKIKYFGRDTADIEEAMQQVFNIRDKLQIFHLQKYGLQLSESKKFKEQLADVGINIGKKSENYYYWYDEAKITNQLEVDDKINKIFFKGMHKFYPLNTEINNLLSERHLDLIVEFNGKVFEEKLSKYMNEDYPVEISESGKNIIIHCDVEEQAQIPEHEIKMFFKNLIYFFINYEEDYDEEEEKIQGIEEIEKKLNDNGINWKRNRQLIVIGYNKKSDKQNEIHMNDSTFLVEQCDKKQFLNIMEEIFKINKKCMIEIPESDDTDLDKDSSQYASKKYTVEYRRFGHIWGLTPKNKKESTLRDIIDKHVMTPAFEKKSRKQIQSPKKGVDSSISFLNDSKINDTSMNHRSITIDNGESMLKGEMKMQEPSSLEAILPKEIDKKFTEKLQNYKLKIDDVFGKDKYSDEAEKIGKKKKSKINEQFDLFLQDTTNQKFRSSDVEIPSKFEREIKGQDNIVTVFVSNDETEKLYKEPICIKFVQKWSNSIGNGWLINTPKDCIKEEQGKLLVSEMNFEIIKHIRFVKS